MYADVRLILDPGWGDNLKEELLPPIDKNGFLKKQTKKHFTWMMDAMNSYFVDESFILHFLTLLCETFSLPNNQLVTSNPLKGLLERVAFNWQYFKRFVFLTTWWNIISPEMEIRRSCPFLILLITSFAIWSSYSTSLGPGLLSGKRAVCC